jgi:hypothetical protein
MAIELRAHLRIVIYVINKIQYLQQHVIGVPPALVFPNMVSSLSLLIVEVGNVFC